MDRLVEKKETKLITPSIEKLGFSNRFNIIAGPCSIENREIFFKTASRLVAEGVKIIRGGTYKIRTSPYSFQGLGALGLEIMKETADELGFKSVSEMTDVRQLDAFMKNIDIIQIGARNMFNSEMLKEVGRTEHPVILKRAPSARIEEFLDAAEYIVSEGNKNVILCERGIVSFDSSTRNCINIADPVILKQRTNLPVIVDPSHGVGNAAYIPTVSKAVAALGVDGIMLEVHDDPSKALSDGFQTISVEEFIKIHKQMQKIANV